MKRQQSNASRSQRCNAHNATTLGIIEGWLPIFPPRQRSRTGFVFPHTLKGKTVIYQAVLFVVVLVIGGLALVTIFGTAHLAGRNLYIVLRQRFWEWRAEMQARKIASLLDSGDLDDNDGCEEAEF